MPLIHSQMALPHCCGVDDLGGFHDVRGDRPDYYVGRTRVQRSGTGLFTATFVDDATQHAYYNKLCRSHTLLFQSEVKRNRGSGNDLFLCVFQYGKPRTRRVPQARDPNWPLTQRPGERLPNL